jgi:DMSO/TMAO reductase YedYZ heme-binding membrane subunit
VSPQWWWYVTRASGIVAWLALTASVLWGVVLSTKAFPEHRRPAWLLDLHRWLGALTLAFVAMHIGAILADGFVDFGPLDVAVPFRSEWRTGAVALGIVAAWLVVAVQLTSVFKRRMPRRAWRWVHLTSYVVFWLTSLHAAFAGTDRGSNWYLGTSIASIMAVAWATMYRIGAGRRSGTRSAASTPSRDEHSTADTAPVTAGTAR